MIPSDGPPPAPTDLIPFSNQTIIDVENSFRDAIARYTLVEQAAAALATDIATLGPQQILHRSWQLTRMQQDLASQDDQIIAILNLAGPEILNASFIKSYQRILAKVIIDCNQVWEQLVHVKKNLLNRLDNTQIS